jgi:DNA-binding IclR family transcriptional regulator
VAAPIFDRHGECVAACTIAAPTDRLQPQIQPFCDEVRRAARAISTLLGHRPPDETNGARRNP